MLRVKMRRVRSTSVAMVLSMVRKNAMMATTIIPTCLFGAECGDGVVQVGVEACDDGNLNNTDDCLNNCVAAIVWRWICAERSRACDDANQDNTDGLSCIAGGWLCTGGRGDLR